MKMGKIIRYSLTSLLFMGSLSSVDAKEMLCLENKEEYGYCSKLEQYHYKKLDNLENILFMTDRLDYLKSKDLKGRAGKDLKDKIFFVMRDINKVIKVAANEVRKQKYKAIGMIVQPVKYGSNEMLKYHKNIKKVARGKLNKRIKDFYKQIDEFDDTFLTDILRVNGSTFIIYPEIVQFQEMVRTLQDQKEVEFQIAIDGFFGLEKGLSESVVTLGLKIDKKGRIRRVFDRKTEYAKIKQAIMELVNNALGDIASQVE